MNSGLNVDPLQLKTLIGSIVEVPPFDNNGHTKTGRLIAVDPVSSR